MLNALALLDDYSKIYTSRFINDQDYNQWVRKNRSKFVEYPIIYDDVSDITEDDMADLCSKTQRNYLNLAS